MIIIISFLIFIIWFIPFIKNEILTNKYCIEFYEYKNDMIGNIEKIKVVNYSKNKAEIYCISNVGGFVISFIRYEEKWQEDNMECIWSFYGSASQIYWPYLFDYPLINKTR